MLPDAQKTLKSLNTDLNGLQTTIAQANDLLNEKNRATIAAALNNLNGAIAELRPEIGRTLKHADDLIVDAQPKISSTLADVQELTKKIAPMLDDLKKTIKTADDTIAHVDGTLGENREDLRASVTALRRVLDQSNALVGQLNATLNDNSDDIDESVENIRQATENLRQLTDMLRTSPASIIRGTGRGIKRFAPLRRWRYWSPPVARPRRSSTINSALCLCRRRPREPVPCSWWDASERRRHCRIAAFDTGKAPTPWELMSAIAGRILRATW
jgi:ABC-type transporter Mla subunit MlaD